ncbi:large subunit ribosomal protein L13Ae [Nematocida displodere]|uniref:Large subunit ribosomal protein L13Ae n=1 Tax=Nematocida displodere TaxID=1805483 RepID=A0A177EEG2_9MICR|nr:large subunit ribosomal protein L13Ae [Nematocida displodere]
MATTGRKLVIDAKGHIVGRLAAYVAKASREGYEVVVLRAEGTIFSSPLERLIKIYEDKKRKRCLVNPKKGPFHYKEPSKCFRRVVRGMLNYKGVSGSQNYASITIFDGIPLEYENVERVVCTHALASTQINPDTKRCTLGEVCAQMGWSNGEILKKFETQRLIRAEEVAKTQRAQQQKKEDFINSDGFKKELSELISKIE